MNLFSVLTFLTFCHINSQSSYDTSTKFVSDREDHTRSWAGLTRSRFPVDIIYIFVQVEGGKLKALIDLIQLNMIDKLLSYYQLLTVLNIYKYR